MPYVKKMKSLPQYFPDQSELLDHRRRSCLQCQMFVLKWWLLYNEDILHAAGKGNSQDLDAFRGMCYKIWKWSERENNEIASLQTSPEGYLYFMDRMLLEEGTEKDRNDIGTISEVLKRLQEIYVYSTSENAEYSYLDETRLFNEGKLAIYVNGVWGASMISENINAKYALSFNYIREEAVLNLPVWLCAWKSETNRKRRLPSGS